MLFVLCVLEKKRQINYHSARLPVCAPKPEPIARRSDYRPGKTRRPNKERTGFELWVSLDTTGL